MIHFSQTMITNSQTLTTFSHTNETKKIESQIKIMINFFTFSFNFDLSFSHLWIGLVAGSLHYFKSSSFTYYRNLSAKPEWSEKVIISPRLYRSIFSFFKPVLSVTVILTRRWDKR